MNLIDNIRERVAFKLYKNQYGIDGTITHWADGEDFTPFLLKDWITRQHIKSTLKTHGYRVAEHPNPFRLNAYIDNEEFIIDCPNTSATPTPWGRRPDPPIISVIPVKWVCRETVSSYLVTDIPNRSGMVGVEERTPHLEEMVGLMCIFGKVITPYG